MAFRLRRVRRRYANVNDADKGIVQLLNRIGLNVFLSGWEESPTGREVVLREKNAGNAVLERLRTMVTVKVKAKVALEQVVVAVRRWGINAVLRRCRLVSCQGSLDIRRICTRP